MLGVVLSGAWLLERTTLVAADPLAPFSDAVIAHPFAVAAGFALLAIVCQPRGLVPSTTARSPSSS